MKFYTNKTRSVSRYIVFVLLMLVGHLTTGNSQHTVRCIFSWTGPHPDNLGCNKTVPVNLSLPLCDVAELLVSRGAATPNTRWSNHGVPHLTATHWYPVHIPENGEFAIVYESGEPPSGPCGMGSFGRSAIMGPVNVYTLLLNGSQWGEYIANTLTTLLIPDTVTDIKDFDRVGPFVSLENLYIPHGVESIGSGAFNDSLSLEQIIIPNSVTSIGGSAFSRSGLRSVTIPSSVKSIGGSAFYGCPLNKVTISNGVESIGVKAFSNTVLQKVEIPDSVNSIGQNAFFECYSLKDINVSKGNANYSSENGVLYNKDKTLLLMCPEGKVGNYTVPQGVTKIDVEAFSQCSLTAIRIPNSVTSIDALAFTWSTSLKRIIFEGNAPQITRDSFGGKLIGVPSDLNINFQDNATGFDQGFGGVSMDRINRLELHSLTVTTGGLGESVVLVFASPPDWNGLEHNLVGGTTRFSRVYIHEEEVTVQATTLTQLPKHGEWIRTDTTVTFLYWLANGEFISTDPTVTFMMDNDLILQAVYGSNVDPDIDPDIDPDTHILSDSAYSITGDSVTITGETVSGVLDIPATIHGKRVRKIGDNAFQGISGLKSVKIPNGVTSIGKKAFFGCSGLTSVTIPDSVTSIGKYAFQDCVNLKSVTIPDSVTIIDYATFKGCTKLAKVTIGNSVTSIGYFAFEYCNSLTSVTIPESVTRIRDEAFKYSGLIRIFFKGNAPIFGNGIFYMSRLRYGRIVILEGATGFGKTFEYPEGRDLRKIPILILERIKINSVSKSASSFTISFESKSGSTYLIQASHDLKKWGVIGIAQGTGSSVEFTDRRDEFIFHKQYYRVKLVE